MLVCSYCGEPAPDNPVQSCCGEVHFEDTEECPACGSENTQQCHHHADALAPECDYWECECGHQFWHS